MWNRRSSVTFGAMATSTGSKVVRTQSEVASACGVSVACVRAWRMRDPPMPGESGSYDLDEIHAWRKKWIKPTKETTASEDRKRLLEGQARLTEAKANREERLDRKEEENIVELEDVERFISEFLNEARRQLQRIPGDFKQGYPVKLRATIQEDLQNRLDMYLRGMHNFALRLEGLKNEK